MAARHDLGLRQKRTVTKTYGRTTTRQRPKSTISGLPTAEKTNANKVAGPAGGSTRQQITTRSPSLDSSSPEPLALGSPTDSSGKKRKLEVANLYSSPDKGRDELQPQSSDESSPSAPNPRRSRRTSPQRSRVARAGRNNSSRRLRSNSADMDIDPVDGRLPSSPPPTPPAPEERRLETREVPKQQFPFSPGTMEAFDRLPNTVGQQPQIQQIVVRLAPKRQPNPKSPDSYEIPPDSPLRSVREARGRPVTLASKASNKPRLVDRLKQQAEEHDEPTGSEKSDSQVSWGEPVVLSQTSETSAVASPASPQSPGARRLQKSTKTRTTFARSTSGLKRVYGQDRITLLEEEDPYAAIGMAEDLPPVSKGRSLELVTHKAKSSLNLEDDPVESGSPGKARIRDIHELRQAGANSRAADEMHDFSIQIGSPGSKPSSSRRAALLQISDKVREKEFRRLLRDHGVDAMVLKDAGKESDIISGYLIAAILVHLLATSPSAHIARLLRAEEVGSLFGRLLGVDHDMKKIARERKTNLSKRSQASLAAIQTALMELPIWNASKPTNVSPRKVTLACLNLLVAEDVTLAGDLAIFPSSVTDQLFTFLSVARNDDFWDSTDVSSEGFDARYAGSVLELHALKSMESQVDSDKWMTDYIPTVADAFGATLQKPAASNSKLEHSLLKLVVDMTNFNPNALEVFVSRNILPALARSVCGSFAQALALVLEDEWTSEVSDRLVLKLAALINFVEQSMPARRAFYESHSESNSPMRELIRIFLDNHRALAEADSEAKGHLNVAFGYLSVFLGYLSLYPPVRQVFRSSHRAKNLRPMLDSIQEFTNVHRTAGVHAGYAERLQDLVDKLENDSTYD